MLNLFMLNYRGTLIDGKSLTNSYTTRGDHLATSGQRYPNWTVERPENGGSQDRNSLSTGAGPR